MWTCITKSIIRWYNWRILSWTRSWIHSTEKWSYSIDFRSRFRVMIIVYNICFLNIMMGFIVETFMHLKDQAYNLNLLKNSQRCWVLIKNSINCLVPKPVVAIPENSSAQRKFLFGVTTNYFYLLAMDFLVYINAGLYMITSYGF